MFKILRPTKDTYITNRVVNDVQQVSGNVGAAGSLDLFKVYGLQSSGSHVYTELSRLLIKFDLQPLRDLISDGKIDVNHSTFSCKLYLHDVYGGQPTPNNFDVSVYPLSASFDEGLGRDVVFYSDYDTCNWLTGSIAIGGWYLTGCAQGGLSTTSCDYITASSVILNGASLLTSQSFTTGIEDLNVDVTTIVSATIAGKLPDQGFRISLASSLETDTRTYFVKRFASRTAFNEDLRPKLIVRYDDSVQDDTNDLYMDANSYMFMYNYVRSAPTNILSSSTYISGSNCLILQMRTPISGGHYSLYFTGSQHYSGINAQTGIYSASVLIPSTDTSLRPQWLYSGSLTFTPIWRSLDGTVAYLTGSTVTAHLPQRGSTSLAPKQFVVSPVGLRSSYRSSENSTVRINIFDHTSTFVTSTTRLPVESPGITVRDVHYQIRDAQTDRIAIPFDTTTNSTRLSNDSSGMFFKLDTSNLTQGHSYVIDVLVVTNDNEQLYKRICAPFKVDAIA